MTITLTPRQSQLIRYCLAYQYTHAKRCSQDKTLDLVQRQKELSIAEEFKAIEEIIYTAEKERA